MVPLEDLEPRCALNVLTPVLVPGDAELGRLVVAQSCAGLELAGFGRLKSHVGSVPMHPALDGQPKLPQARPPGYGVFVCCAGAVCGG
jgi:hypothetical protein